MIIEIQIQSNSADLRTPSELYNKAGDQLLQANVKHIKAKSKSSYLILVRKSQ